MRTPNRSDWAINKNIDKRIKELGGGGGMAQHSNEYHDPDMALATHAHDATYAPIAKGVTGGDTHDHVGGDGAQIDHAGLANKGTNTHAQVDTHLAASAPHSGHETPAGAQAKVDAHKDLTTGVHGVGASTVESASGSQAKVDAHKDLATGVHGAGVSTLETVAGSQAKVDTHKGADVSATVHPNAYTHIGASAPHVGHALDSEFDTHVALTTSAHGGVLASTAFVGLAKITVGITAPSTPGTGDLWIDTN